MGYVQTFVSFHTTLIFVLLSIIIKSISHTYNLNFMKINLGNFFSDCLNLEKRIQNSLKWKMYNILSSYHRFNNCEIFFSIIIFLFKLTEHFNFEKIAQKHSQIFFSNLNWRYLSFLDLRIVYCLIFYLVFMQNYV